MHQCHGCKESQESKHHTSFDFMGEYISGFHKDLSETGDEPPQRVINMYSSIMNISLHNKATKSSQKIRTIEMLTI
jgi:hypothetical protein